MDYKTLSTVLIKITGIVLIVMAVVALPQHINSYLYQGHDTLAMFLIWVMLPLLAPLMIGTIMWYFPGIITNKIFDKKTDITDLSKSAHEIEKIAITILGLILLFFALSDLVFNIIYIYLKGKEQADTIMSFRVSAEDWGNIAGTLVELIFAFILLLKAKGVIMLIKKLRA